MKIAATPDWLGEAHKELTRVRAINAALVEALELAKRALNNSLRSAGSSTAGFIASRIASRKLMAAAEQKARAALDKART